MTTLESLDAPTTVLVTEFRTELRHLATKEDLAELRANFMGELKAIENRLMLRLGGLYIAGIGVAVAIMKLWQ